MMMMKYVYFLKSKITFYIGYILAKNNTDRYKIKQLKILSTKKTENRICVKIWLDNDNIRKILKEIRGM